MVAQLSGMKKPGGGDAMELRSLAARAANAERRLNNAQNQLVSTEEKIAAINQKNAVADSKWEARVKEYEARLKAAEERVKRERQGSKERVGELENNLKCVSSTFCSPFWTDTWCFRSLQRQLELAQKRNNQLNDVMESNKASGSNSPAR
jgi:chromosome segregation ATPase